MQPELSRIDWPGLLFFVLILALVLARPRRRLRESHALQRHLRRDWQQRIKRIFTDDLVNALRMARNRRSDDHGVHS